MIHNIQNINITQIWLIISRKYRISYYTNKNTWNPIQELQKHLNWEADRRMRLHSQEKLSAIWNNQTICLQHSVFSNWRMVKWMKEWLKRQKSECHFNNPSELTTCPHGRGVPHFGAIVISIFMDFDPYKHSYCVYVLRPSPILHLLCQLPKCSCLDSFCSFGQISL